jgi:hypothetical protein
MARRQRQRAGLDAEKAPGIAPPKMPEFPEWLAKYEAVREQASKLWSQLPHESDPVKAQRVLEQLITNLLMERVWGRLYQKSHSGEGSGRHYKYAGIVTPKSRSADLRRRAFLLLTSDKPDTKEAAALYFEAKETEKMKDWGAYPRWSEQDRAVQWFLYHIYKNAIDNKPMLRSDLEAECTSLRMIAGQLRGIAEVVKSHGLQADAAQLEGVATNCESEALNIDPGRFSDDPALIKHKLGDEHLRTFVIATCGAARLLFGHNLYGTVASIANVVLNPKVEIGTGTVREIIRAPKAARVDTGIA